MKASAGLATLETAERSIRSDLWGKVKAFMRSLGFNLEQYLVQDAIAKPHRTIMDGNREEINQLEVLGNAIKNALFKELREHLRIGIVMRIDK